MTKEEFFNSLEDNLSKAEIGFKSYNKALDDVSGCIRGLRESISVDVDKNYYTGYKSALFNIIKSITKLRDGIYRVPERTSVCKNDDRRYCAMADNVYNPSHYATGKFECIDVMEEVFGIEAVKDFCICNAFKYLYRYKRKNGAEDIEKAHWYLTRYLALEDKNEDR